MDPVFPLEIFSLIITQVALAYQTQDLHSCSQVCKDFAALSQPHLFKLLSIDWYAADYTKPRLRRLAQRVKIKPALGEYIQEISCSHKGPVLEEYDENLDECLLALLNLPNLHHLLICSHRGVIDYNICRTDIFGYRSMVERYLVSGTLTSLILMGFRNLPIQPILACATLRTVEFRDIAFIEPSPHEPFIHQHAALPFRRLKLFRVTNFPYSILKQLETSLESLVLGGPLEYHRRPIITPLPNGEFIRFDRLTSLTSWTSWTGMDWESLLGRESRASCKSFPALKHLSVELYTDQDETAVNTIFDHVQVLEGLELRATSPHLSPNLSRLASVITDMNPTLKSLGFIVTYNNFSQELITTFTSSILSQPRHALESLELRLTFCIFEPSEIFPPATHDQDVSYQRCWRNLALCLKDRDRFPCLHLVKIRIILRLDIEKFQEYEDEVFEAFLRGPLHEEDFFESTTRGFEVEFRHSIVRVDEQSLF